jgi:hypothetical protein
MKMPAIIKRRCRFGIVCDIACWHSGREHEEESGGCCELKCLHRPEAGKCEYVKGKVKKND